uniref:Uncharacterized protein n=1 Tax=Meloidogyne enterolobii TaxID=390850 RepID=A0A6V7WTK3_MELEN|nr:unnamed protein product [Meloidogyne enterolobii]
MNEYKENDLLLYLMICDNINICIPRPFSEMSTPNSPKTSDTESKTVEVIEIMDENTPVKENTGQLMSG